LKSSNGWRQSRQQKEERAMVMKKFTLRGPSFGAPYVISRTEEPEEGEEALRLGQAAEWLFENGRYAKLPSYQTMRRWVLAGFFPNAAKRSTRYGQPWFIPLSDLNNFEAPLRGRPAR
jgi:hypothetical protein